LANRKNQVKSHPARTLFGELVIYQDRCETSAEIARAALADPVKSDSRQSLDIPISTRAASGRGEHDLCFIFTGPATGPLYAIDDVKLLRHE
jgi:hypothetical protein